MSQKNYYEILGIEADEKDLPWDEFESILKKQYRKLSKQFHPDCNPNDKVAEEKFKDVAEAYSVLSNREKRQQYDNPMGAFNSFFGNDPFGGFNPFDAFNPFKGRSGNGSQRANVGKTIRIEIALTLEEIYEGVEKTIKYKREVPCDDCNGTGLGEGGKYTECPVCGGTGMEVKSNGFVQQMFTCRRCKGSGQVATKICDTCNGTGMKIVEHEVTFTVPKGIQEGMSLVMKGEGCLGSHKDSIPGDLIIVIAMKPNERFVRRGNDLLFELNVPIITAIAGGEINVTTIDGKILKATIEEGTEEGSSIRFSNKGMPVYEKDGRFGHMIGVVKLTMPKSLNDEERRLLNELKEQEHFKTEEQCD